jgi:putative membrane protein
VGTPTVGCDPTATLACGAAAIQDGATQLSEQGSKKLIAEGSATASSYGEQYALMEALNKRAATQAGVPNGPAQGTGVVTTAAYGYTLDGVSRSDQTNVLRFLIAAVLLVGAVAGGMALARR